MPDHQSTVDSIIIQAHRGAGDLLPENTIESFCWAWDQGLVPEADVRTTRDGILVAFHDEAPARIAPGAPEGVRCQNVRDLEWPALARLDVGSWRGAAFAGARVPRLAEVFAVLREHPGRRLYADVKEASIEALIEEVRRSGVSSQVIVASPHAETLREWARLVPGGQTLHWMGGDDETLRFRLETLRACSFAGITELQIHIEPGWGAPGRRRDPASIGRRAVDPFVNTDAFLRSVAVELEHRGILFQVLPWKGAGDQIEVYWKLLDIGAGSFATDFPDLALKAVTGYRPLLIA